ncbi:recombination protein F [Solibacillus isronensis B3W22]|uniref:Nuclease SbcCD subunit C n=1 Tax=Solibacillus isronensis B3W22 TaxID=1224748 RepID=K1KT45_9BACL|nr:AAA family ATPase [Solibacillus isronensis]AMO86765.1 hypothetical protein SOLI23_14660 [Solibacillus silvestris]EKB45671.1 recombination protein F [Solibacillus isronensis B3W22]
MLLNPIHDWLLQLENVKLTGILTEKFSNTKVNNYIEGESFLSSSINSLAIKKGLKVANGGEDLPIIHKIDGVYLHEFRPSSSINYNSVEFKQVNIIYGKNGTGKSSLLEAIEFAITNEIRSVTDYKDKTYKNMSTEVICTTQNGQTILSSSKKTDMLKKLEAFWYGTSSGTGKAMLNDQFFRFNFFDTYSAYKFALEESVDPAKRKDSNYIDKFSRLLFSDQVIVMEKNWLRYKDAFENQLNELTKKYEDRLSSYSMYKQWASEENSSQYNVKLSNTLSLLQKMNINVRYIERLKTNKEEILEFFEILLQHIETVDQNIYVENNKTYLEIMQKRQSLLSSISSISDEIEEDRQAFLKLNDSNLEIKEKTFQTEREIKEKNKEIKYIEETLESCKLLSPILLNEKIVSRVKELSAYEQQIRQYLYFIQVNKKSYQKVHELDVIFLLETEEIKHLKEALKDYENQYQTLAQNESEMKNLFNKMETIQLQLVDLGIEYLEYADSSHQNCPLCGTSSISKSKLIEQIQMTVSTKKEKGIASILKEKRELEHDISTIRLKLSRHEDSQNVLALYEEACKIKGLTRKDFTIDLQQMKAVIGNYDETENELQKTEEQLSLLANEGFTLEKINEAEHILNTNTLFLNAYLDLKQFISYLKESRDEKLRQKANLEAKLKELEDTTHKYLLDKERIFGNKIEKQEIFEEKSKILKEINNVVQLIKAGSAYFTIPEDMKIVTWLNLFKEAHIKCKNLINEFDSPEYYQRRMKETEKEIEKLKVSLNHVKEAVDGINGLRALSSYAEEIVNQNIGKINKYFKSLHASNEFEEIVVVPEGILLKRKHYDQLSKPHELSTGQRTAIALSILLALHFSATNVPKLLMFDEPVANMDEGQVACFLDLLGEFASKGEQIFFTTASEQMYKTLKEKFSKIKIETNYIELTRPDF